MIQDGLKALLLADSTLASLITTNLFPVVLPRGYSLAPPSCVFHTFSKGIDYALDGATDNKQISLQIDTYATDYATSRNVADAITAVLSAYVGTLSDGTVVKVAELTQDMDMPYLPSADVKGTTFRVMQQFRIVYSDPS